MKLIVCVVIFSVYSVSALMSQQDKCDESCMSSPQDYLPFCLYQCCPSCYPQSKLFRRFREFKLATKNHCDNKCASFTVSRKCYTQCLLDIWHSKKIVKQTMMKNEQPEQFLTKTISGSRPVDLGTDSGSETSGWMILLYMCICVICCLLGMLACICKYLHDNPSALSFGGGCAPAKE